MRRRSSERVTAGSDNVFADIGVGQPEETLAKARLVEAIADLLGRRGLSQTQAGRLVSLTQPQVSRLLRGDTRDFSYERLMRILTSLGQDVEIRIRSSRARSKRGHVFVNAAGT